jgi:ketosteroid isomerase-like protein
MPPAGATAIVGRLSHAPGTTLHTTPGVLLDALVSARDRGDVAAALACYEPDAVVVLEPGRSASGTAAVRAMLETFVSWRPAFRVRGRTILQTGDVALHVSEWTLHGTNADGTPIDLTGLSSDVARRSPDGSWRLAIDNPWGTAVLGAEAAE